MSLPQDPVILLSYVNTQLRDYSYNGLAGFCDDKDIDRVELESKLAAIGYHYSEEHNRFE